MSENLMDLLQGSISSGMIDQFSRQLGGADKQQTAAAASGIVTTLMGALAKNASSTEGAQALNNALERDQTPLLRPEIHIYLRDLYDHTIQVIETVETMRDVIAGMLDIYLSSVSNRTNEIVKFLTIFGSIFIPLTFLAGVYGMNFHFMPELGLRWAYPGFWLITIVIISALLFYFRRKRWI